MSISSLSLKNVDLAILAISETTISLNLTFFQVLAHYVLRMCIELGKTKFCFLKKEVSRMSEKNSFKSKNACWVTLPYC